MFLTTFFVDLIFFNEASFSFVTFYPFLISFNYFFANFPYTLLSTFLYHFSSFSPISFPLPFSSFSVYVQEALSLAVISSSSAGSSLVPVNRALIKAQSYTALRGEHLFFDDNRFLPIRYMFDLRFAHGERIRKNLLEGFGTWERGRKHWEGRSAICLHDFGWYADSVFARCVEERRYESHLATFAESGISQTLVWRHFCCVFFALIVRSGLFLTGKLSVLSKTALQRISIAYFVCNAAFRRVAVRRDLRNLAKAAFTGVCSGTWLVNALGSEPGTVRTQACRVFLLF